MSCDLWTLREGCSDKVLFEFKNKPNDTYIKNVSGLGLPPVEIEQQDAVWRSGTNIKSKRFGAREIVIEHLQCACGDCGFTEVMENLYSKFIDCGVQCADETSCVNTNGKNTDFQICFKEVNTDILDCKLERVQCAKNGDLTRRCIDVVFNGLASEPTVMRGSKQTCVLQQIKFLAPQPFARTCEPIVWDWIPDDLTLSDKPCCYPICFSEGQQFDGCWTLPYGGKIESYPKIYLTGSMLRPTISMNGVELYLDYNIKEGEQVIIDLWHGNKNITNNFGETLDYLKPLDFCWTDWTIKPSCPTEFCISARDYTDGLTNVQINYQEWFYLL